MGECWQMDANGIRQTDPFILARRTIDSASSSFETHFIHSRVAECAHGPHGLSLMRLNLLSSLKQMQNVQILHQNFLNSSQIPDCGILARQAHYGTLAKLSIQITS